LTAFHETFDWAYSYGMTSTEFTVASFGTLRESWSGLALQRLGTVPPFIVPGLDSNGHTNVASQTESALRFWLTPYWSSTSLVGAGPGAWATLAQMVASDGNDAVTLWSLQASPDGSALVLLTQTVRQLGIAQTDHVTPRAEGPGLLVDSSLMGQAAPSRLECNCRPDAKQ
jgi:hypothetical protein